MSAAGVDESLDRLAAFLDAVTAAAEAAVAVSADALAARAAAALPPGPFAESIAVEDAASPQERRVSASAPYARYVEFGTLRRPASPFLYPALLESADDLRQRLIEAMEQAVSSQESGG